MRYISDFDVANAGLGEVPIVDVSDAASPALVGTFALHVHSPHDVTFNADGTRVHVVDQPLRHPDTTDPRSPELIPTIHDPTINIHSSPTRRRTAST